MEHVHLIGIGGSGLSAIARVLLESGYAVSGSDLCDSPLAQALQDAGARVFIGHAAENIAGADLVVRSSAIPDTNVEVQRALEKGIPVIKRADFLGKLMQDRQGIAVAGTHGKTTTSAMIAWMLSSLGQDPSFIVGGIILNLGTNARSGHGTAFVIEADEYDRMFLGLKPHIAVITSMEYDHPDIYRTPDDYKTAFQEFVGCIKSDGVLLLSADGVGPLEMIPAARAKGIRICTYAINREDVDYQARNLRSIPGGGTTFDIQTAEGKTIKSLELQIPGHYNVLNALVATAVLDQYGLSMTDAAKTLTKFQGTERRFDVLGDVGGVTVVDDYAHHPTEIRATLSAARERYPDRELWVVWQPHTYSRTQAFFNEFAVSFVDADHVVVPEVYRSREPVDPGFSAQKIVNAMQHDNAYFVPELKDLSEFLLTHLKRGDVLLVLSAGDADQVSEQVFFRLSQNA